MSKDLYFWRGLTDAQRKDALEYRRLRQFPKHSPPHFDSDSNLTYILTAACYEHVPIIGQTQRRMSDFESAITECCKSFCDRLHSWCILPNHYHLLVTTSRIKELRNEIGLLHGRTSFEWNGWEDLRGRKVWHNCFERKMRSERHFFASLNYVLNNAVHHGYCEKWQDCPWSNATDYLETVGIERALEIWSEYPILDYGSKWDIY